MTIHAPHSVSEDVVHVEFELPDPSCPFVGLSLVGDCEVELEEVLPRREGGYRGFYSVRDADPDRVLREAGTYDGCDARFIDRTEEGGLLELIVSEKCPAMYLAEQRAFPRRVSADAGVGRIDAELLTNDDEDVVDAFLTEYPSAELVAHRQQSYHTPMFSHREFDRAVEGLLTDRQRECLLLAYEAGYYEWPREKTGKQLAETLGISPSTFAQHVRTAEGKLIELLFG